MLASAIVLLGMFVAVAPSAAAKDQCVTRSGTRILPAPVLPTQSVQDFSIEIAYCGTMTGEIVYTAWPPGCDPCLWVWTVHL